LLYNIVLSASAYLHILIKEYHRAFSME